MECSNIQEKLSAYIEEILSPEERTLFYGHLYSCHKCSQALSDLSKTMEYIKNLEGVEPPPWLTQKVMARIRADAVPEKGIIQRLFYPLHIKLPIEVAATIAIAITTIYIFKAIQPEMKLAKAPAEVITSEEKAKKDVIPQSPPLAKGASPRSYQLGGQPSPQDPVEKLSIEGEGGFITDQPKPAKKPELFETKKAPEAPVQVMEQDKTALLTGSVAKEEAKRESMPASAKSKTALPGEKEERISFTITVKDIETAYKEIEKTVTQLGGKVIKTESFENKNIITIEIDSQKMNELSGKLKLIGEVKEVAALYGLKGNIVIRLEIAKF
ncbi:MAG: DUF2275 domain-containing protein [Nitrospirota bacterium]|mgnify:CR=1 FL=1